MDDLVTIRAVLITIKQLSNALHCNIVAIISRFFLLATLLQ